METTTHDAVHVSSRPSGKAKEATSDSKSMRNAPAELWWSILIPIRLLETEDPSKEEPRHHPHRHLHREHVTLQMALIAAKCWDGRLFQISYLKTLHTHATQAFQQTQKRGREVHI